LFAGDMALNLREILDRLRTRITGSKMKRRKALDDAAWSHFPRLRILLLVVGYVWILCLPLKELSRGIYIDENALQPGGVCLISFCSPLPFLTHIRIRYTHTGTGETCSEQIRTSPNWRDCAITMRPALSECRPFHDYCCYSSSPGVQNISAFNSKNYGYPLLSKITASTQETAYVLTSFGYKSRVCNLRQPISGSNAYGILSSPRYSGAEATVISASWLSSIGDGDATLNLRGVATVLSLAAFLNRQSQHTTLWYTRLTPPSEYSLWSKDLIFVISDGYMEGMQAWASAYHGHAQSSTSNIVLLHIS